MILIDSDIWTLFTYGNASVQANLAACPDEEVLAVTIVTWSEVLRGRFDSILKAANKVELVKAVTRFQLSEAALADFRIVFPDETTGEHFERLISQKGLKMRRGDLINACIALTHDALLVTRNLKDYAGVKGLKLEDWSA